MPVSNQPTSFRHAANGVTTVFSFTCQVLDEDDLYITLDEIEVTTGFTISGIGENDGGTVTFDTPPAADVVVGIDRIVELKRDTDYQQNGDFRSSVVNPDFDRLHMINQQQQTLINRAIKFPARDDEAGLNAILPIASERANKALIFDEEGNVVVSDDDYEDQAAAAAASAAAALSDAASAAGSASAAASSASAAASSAASAQAISTAWQLQDYDALRDYAGDRNTAYITGHLVTTQPSGFAGLFTRDADDTTSEDNNGTIIVSDDGTRWKRQYNGPVHVEWFGGVGDGVYTNGVGYTGTDNSVAIAAAADVSDNIEFGRGIFLGSAGVLNRIHGKSIKGAGKGAGYGPNTLLSWQHVTTLVATGTGTKYRLTRRKAPETGADPDDADVSVFINLQAEGTALEDLAVILNCNFQDTSHTNLGDDWDIGILIGCRVQTRLKNVFVGGYFRRQSILLDVTRGETTGEHLAPDGTPFPAGTTLNGADQCYLENVTTWGGTQGFAKFGAKESASGSYHDYRTGSVLTVHGGRGGVGASDFRAVNCTFSSREHHSGRRAYDPLMTFSSEDIDTIPCCVAIDGRRGSSTQARIRKGEFVNCRFTTIEATRVALGRAYEYTFDRCQNEPRSADLVLSAAGADITASYTNQTTHNYGPYAGIAPSGINVGTDRITFIKNPVSANATHFPSTITRTEIDTVSTGESTFNSITITAFTATSTFTIQRDRPAIKLMDTDTTLSNGEDAGVIESYTSDTDGGSNKLAAQIRFVGDGTAGKNKVVFATGTLDALSDRWNIRETGHLEPMADNTLNLGSASMRAAVIYAGTGTINTSDANAKQQEQAISDAVLDAWANVEYLQYKFNDAVEEKGEGARWHFGVIAQRVKAAFEAQGLDAFEYGLLCYDRWEETVEEWRDVYETIPARTDATGEVIPEQQVLVKAADRRVIPAGERYGVRYEEALCLEAALMRRETNRLRAEIALLKNN